MTVELNLVPFIDLLTCVVSFLLITAAWTQLARLEAQQNGRGDFEDPIRRPKLVVLVDEGGFNVVVGERTRIVRGGPGVHDFDQLRSELDQVKRALPDRNDLEVASADVVTFEVLVRTMDTALGAGFPAVSLVQSSPRSQ